MGSITTLIENLSWYDLIDILCVFIIIYRLITLIRGTRAVQMITGLGLITILYLLSNQFKLYTLHFLLKQFFDYLFIIIVILFQDDIRRWLTFVGKTPFSFSPAEIVGDTNKTIEEIVKSVSFMSKRKIGALIVVERETGLKSYSETGVKINSLVNSEIIVSTFLTTSPLHDGAIIIQRNRITCARCLLPLTKNTKIAKEFGTRHRAGIGITEETDAIVVIVSEQTRRISIAINGKIHPNLNQTQIRRFLTKSLNANAV